MRSALCDDQRTTETDRAGGQSGERVTAERERGSLVTTHAMCGDNMGASCGLRSHQVGLSRVSEKIRRSFGSLKYLETFKKDESS